MTNTQKITVTTLAAVAGFALVASQAFAAAVQPDFDAATFSNPTVIDNQWFSMPVGKELEYAGETDEGLEEIEIEISGQTKTVYGVKALVYRDLVYVDGELIEDTRDYIAQDDAGNVWYLGEDVDNYENGVIDNHDGAWLAGVDGALPGYWMPADPKVGDHYRQEYLAGEAEDEAEVISVTEKVKIGLGTYTNCLKTKDTTPLEPDVVEYKYYCKKVGAMVLEEKPEEGESIALVEWEIEDGTEEDDDEDEGREDDDEDDDGEVSTGNARDLQRQLIALLQQLIELLERQS